MPHVAEKQEGLANVFPQAARHWHEGRHPPLFKMVEALAASVNDFERRKATWIQDQTSMAQSEKDQTGFRAVLDFNRFTFPLWWVKCG